MCTPIVQRNAVRASAPPCAVAGRAALVGGVSHSPRSPSLLRMRSPYLPSTPFDPTQPPIACLSLRRRRRRWLRREARRSESCRWIFAINPLSLNFMQKLPPIWIAQKMAIQFLLRVNHLIESRRLRSRWVKWQRQFCRIDPSIDIYVKNLPQIGSH